MNHKVHRFSASQALTAMAAFVIIVAGLKAAHSILVPCVLAIFIALIGSLLIVWLRRFHLPGWLSVTLVMGLIISTLLGLGALVFGSVERLIDIMPQYQQKLTPIIQSLIDWLDKLGIHFPREGFSILSEPGSLVELIRNALNRLVSTLSTLIMVLIIVLFLLMEGTALREKLKVALDPSFDTTALIGVTVHIQRYLSIKTITSLITGILVGVWAWTMGISFAPLWGVLAFLLNYIPYIGSIFASIPAIFLALMEYGIGTSAVVTVGYVVINVGVSNLLEPVMLGRGLGLSPIVVFLSLVFWGWTWGPIGMLLSIPLTMVIKILLEHSRDLRWISVLLSAKIVREDA